MVHCLLLQLLNMDISFKFDHFYFCVNWLHSFWAFLKNKQKEKKHEQDLIWVMSFVVYYNYLKRCLPVTKLLKNGIWNVFWQCIDISLELVEVFFEHLENPV